MKSILISILLCLLSLNAISQETTTSVRYDGNGNVIGGSHFKNKPGKSIKLIDSTTMNYYVLDSKHIFITAHNKSGKVLWKTDPYKDNHIQEYRTNRPVIVSFSLENRPNWQSGKKSSKEKILWIVYDNTQFGFINLITGKYEFQGQD